MNERSRRRRTVPGRFMPPLLVLRHSTLLTAYDSGYRLGQWHGFEVVLEALASNYTDPEPEEAP